MKISYMQVHTVPQNTIQRFQDYDSTDMGIVFAVIPFVSWDVCPFRDSFSNGFCQPHDET